MSLYSVDSKEQKAIGVRKHWNLFKEHQDSPLHLLIKQAIEERLQSEETINSRLFGKKLLDEKQEQIQALDDSLRKEQLSSLYGMILWNTLANQEEKWLFCKQPKSHLDAASAVLYFRHIQ